MRRFRSYRGKGRANQEKVHDPAEPGYYGKGKGQGKDKGGKGEGKGKDKGDKGKSCRGMKGKGKGKDSAKAASPTHCRRPRRVAYSWKERETYVSCSL